jgi:hypothetical protein
MYVTTPGNRYFNMRMRLIVTSTCIVTNRYANMHMYVESRRIVPRMAGKPRTRSVRVVEVDHPPLQVPIVVSSATGVAAGLRELSNPPSRHPRHHHQPEVEYHKRTPAQPRVIMRPTQLPAAGCLIMYPSLILIPPGSHVRHLLILSLEHNVRMIGAGQPIRRARTTS